MWGYKCVQVWAFRGVTRTRRWAPRNDEPPPGLSPRTSRASRMSEASRTMLSSSSLGSAGVEEAMAASFPSTRPLFTPLVNAGAESRRRAHQYLTIYREYIQLSLEFLGNIFDFLRNIRQRIANQRSCRNGRGDAAVVRATINCLRNVNERGYSIASARFHRRDEGAIPQPPSRKGEDAMPELRQDPSSGHSRLEPQVPSAQAPPRGRRTATLSQTAGNGGSKLSAAHGQRARQ